MERVGGEVSVGVIAGPGQRVVVGRRVVARLPGDRTTLGDVAEWIVAERLAPLCSAVDADQPAQIIVARYALAACDSISLTLSGVSASANSD